MANKYNAEVINVEGTLISLKFQDGSVATKNCTQKVSTFAKPGMAEVSEKDGMVTFVKGLTGPQSHSQSTSPQSNGNVPANFQSGSNYQPKPKKNREEFREEAENAVKDNLNSAQKIAEMVGLTEYTGKDLVAIGDMVGRTITSLVMGSK